MQQYCMLAGHITARQLGHHKQHVRLSSANHTLQQEAIIDNTLLLQRLRQ